MLDTGEPHLFPVLCLHSLFLDPRAFDGLAEAGRGRFRFVAPDLPGQAGRVGEADSTITMDEVAEDVLGLAGDLGLTRIALVGQSMGGDVAVRIAARVPGLVERLVLMGSSACAESPDNAAAFGAMADSVAAQGFEDQTVDELMGILFARSVLDDPARHDVHVVWRTRLTELEPRLVHAARGVVERPDVTSLLPLISAPTLIVSGVEDLVRPAAWSDEMFDAIPDAELWRIKGAGHSPLIEAPDRVIARVLDFLLGAGRPATPVEA
ncbi:alpha/beta fold hydrolase [Amycolatopsis jejuensis]|uniref:alpha/beta fold hydrolase n=1 Tax=Amycolatopsis jejuensis TaxID=330084 RepID=UPI00068AB897|nr:alpha/beta hydrolase [Amycolatopsis jejuensis]